MPLNKLKDISISQFRSECFPIKNKINTCFQKHLCTREKKRVKKIYLSVMVAYVLFTKRVMSGHFSAFLLYFIL